MTAHTTPCIAVATLKKDNQQMRKELDANNLTLYGNGDRSHGLTYQVEKLRNSRGFWLQWLTTVLGITGLLIAVLSK